MQHILKTLLPILLLFATLPSAARGLNPRNIVQQGGIVQGDSAKKQIALVFTADGWADGAETITATLKEKHIKGSFFFTGKFYQHFPDVIRQLVKDKHYVGTHGFGHLLYFPWDRRDTMLVSHTQFNQDIQKGYAEMARFGIKKEQAPYFIPAFEHYNDTISLWAHQLGLQVVNYTSGTRSNADYTTPDMKNYIGSKELLNHILDFETQKTLNGHLLLIHFGTHPNRTDKFYRLLPRLIDELQSRGYHFVTVKQLVEK